VTAASPSGYRAKPSAARGRRGRATHAADPRAVAAPHHWPARHLNTPAGERQEDRGTPGPHGPTCASTPARQGSPPQVPAATRRAWSPPATPEAWLTTAPAPRHCQSPQPIT